MSTETNVAEPSFKISYATAILTLVILIPIVYIVATNLSSSAAPQQQEVTKNQNITKYIQNRESVGDKRL